jgi:hypothetical protein
MRLLEGLLGFLVVVGALMSRRPPRRLPTGVDAEDLADGYERSDASVGWIVACLGILLVTLAVALIAISTLQVLVTGLPASLGRPADLVDRLANAPTPPPPRLENAEGEQYAAYRAQSEQRLSQYGWIDRGSGRVSIPIQRAIDVLAERGLPSQTETNARDNAGGLPSRASSGRVPETTQP